MFSFASLNIRRLRAICESFRSLDHLYSARRRFSLMISASSRAAAAQGCNADGGCIAVFGCMPCFFHAAIIPREELTIAPLPFSFNAKAASSAVPPCAPYPGTRKNVFLN